MKHTSKVTLILLFFFLISQILGLALLSGEVQPTVQVEDNQTTIFLNSSVISEIPAYIFDWKAILYLVVGVGLGTTLILIFRKLSFGGKLWKVWYFLAVWVSVNLSLKLIFSTFNFEILLAGFISAVLSFVLAFLKIQKQNFYIHNLTEVLMYVGIGIFIALLFNNDMLFASIILLLISIYDAIAVWRSKHMVSLAEFTMKEKLFPGLAMNYEKLKYNKTKIHSSLITSSNKNDDSGKKQKNQKIHQAILGGGDIIFPLIFSGVLLGWLFNKGFSQLESFLLSLIVSLFSALSLYLLFYYGKKDRFYPAMPYISAGCFFGFGIVYLITLFI